MGTASIGSEKPLVVLVHHPSLFRLWMERRIEKNFRLCVFSGAEEALAFIRSTPSLGAVVTDLDFGSAGSKGTSIARKVRRRFGHAPVFLFAVDDKNDPRVLLLRNLGRIYFLSMLGALFIERQIKKALQEK